MLATLTLPAKVKQAFVYSGGICLAEWLCLSEKPVS